MSIENFTTGWTEADPGADLTVTATKVTATDASSADNYYLVKDMGVGNISNFDTLIKFRWTSNTGAFGGILTASNTIGNLETQNGGIDSIQLYYETGVFDRIAIYDLQNDAGDGSIAITLGTDYWIRFKRSSTTLTATIYTDQALTSIFDTLTITCTSDTLRYFSTAVGGGYAVSTLFNGYVENLDLEYVPTITASLTKETRTIITNTSSATKAKSAIASPTQSLISVTTNATTASKGVNKTASPANSTVTVQVNTTTASKTVSKTAQLTTAYVTVRTGALTASSGVTPETKTASTTNQLISVVAGTPSVSKTVIKTATTTTTYISVTTNSVTCTAVKIKTASSTQTLIRLVVNSTSGQIPSGTSGIDLTAIGKSRINRVINSEELKVIR